MWDGVTNIEVSLYHGTDGPLSEYGRYGLMTKTLPSDHATNLRFVWTGSTSLTDRSWNATQGTTDISFYIRTSTAGLQVEFVTPGCASTDLDGPDCSSISDCLQCIARVDCAHLVSAKHGSSACRSQSYADQNKRHAVSLYDSPSCPRSCASYKTCYECRNETRHTTCYWAQ